MGERAPNYGKYAVKTGFWFTRRLNMKGVTGFWNKLQNRNWYNIILVLCCWRLDQRQNRANESSCNTYLAHQFLAHSWALPNIWSAWAPWPSLWAPCSHQWGAASWSTPNAASSSPPVLAYRVQGGLCPFFPSAWWGSIPGWGWLGNTVFRIGMAQLVCPLL